MMFKTALNSTWKWVIIFFGVKDIIKYQQILHRLLSKAWWNDKRNKMSYVASFKPIPFNLHPL